MMVVQQETTTALWPRVVVYTVVIFPRNLLRFVTSEVYARRVLTDQT